MMSDDISKMVVKSEIAKPIHHQVLEKCLNIEHFLSSVESYLQELSGDDVDASSNSEGELVEVNAITGETIWNGVATTKEDRRLDRERYYNFSKIKDNRKWLKDILVSDSSDSSDSEITEEDFKHMLKEHALKRKHRRNFFSRNKTRQYMYYSTGLLSCYDKFPEHQGESLGITKKKKQTSNTPPPSAKKDKPKKIDVDSDTNLEDSQDIDLHDDVSIPDHQPSTKKTSHKKKGHVKNAEVLAQRRRKLWALMAKKEVIKVQRSKNNNHKDMLTSCRRVATYCMRHCRQRAMQSQKNMKEVISRVKRLSREMQVYWKRFERVERETRRRLEKEAEEQRKLDIELMEAKRQQRKLNFLITQTELYAHFMSKKLGGGSEEDQLRILSQLEEEKNPRLATLDDYDCDAEKERLVRGVEEKVAAELARTREFGVSESSDARVKIEPGIDCEAIEDKPQPQIFHGKLKAYQRKGMTWLANLYDQGINGILADEMGLGKTVQSIAFLCHIAEKYSVWGPFLIISPASTLHNWLQEMARFAPHFKVVPYWGNIQDRKILRTFWDQKGLHTKNASFHVVITSYQLVITDIKYFNRIKWQYMILDEAQAIKSSSSMRWKLLLGFNCRNRLLLSGTPIQNSMAELWALLHFIMPAMFDSHDEFNEWFSKDIESHAENKTGIDEKHLSRLHMILKPFMLRRVKADVENELSDKIEIMVYCPMTTRQQILYRAVKKKIRIEDLLHSTGSYQSAQSITSNLMNLVMQFRKVCNHPELFERREARSPLSVTPEDYCVPRLLVPPMISRPSHLIHNKLSPFTSSHIISSLYSDLNVSDGSFSFTYLINMSPMELYRIFHCGLIQRWLELSEGERRRVRRPSIISEMNLPAELLFTSYTSTFYAHLDVTLHSMPETTQHRLIRSKKLLKQPVMQIKQESQQSLSPRCEGMQSLYIDFEPSGNGTKPIPKMELVEEFVHKPRPPTVLTCWPVSIPSFLTTSTLKVESRSRLMFASSQRWTSYWQDHCECHTREAVGCVYFGSGRLADELSNPSRFPSFRYNLPGGLLGATPPHGWSNITIPDKESLLVDSGKLTVLDCILKRLKEEGHRVLIYSQMTRMIDLLEEYMWYRKHTFMRLDGSSKISDRRDMVADFQNRTDIFVFLLSTRAGGLGINLTAADTVIFYDSDWNPTVDQQAMDRAHRLGQTKQVTVYRLICKGTIEERILQRAREKSEIQRMVISGGNFKPDSLKPKEVVSLLLDDAEIEQKYRQKQEERRLAEENKRKEYKRKHSLQYRQEGVKQIKTENGDLVEVFDILPEMVEVGVPLTEPESNIHQPSSSIDLPRPILSLKDRVKRGKRGRPPCTARRGISRPLPLSHMPPIGPSLSGKGSRGLLVGEGRGGRRLSSSRGRGRPRIKRLRTDREFPC